MKKQKGFTLIELIIVIVVLGILAVTAAPNFFNFAGDARVSVVNGAAGAANSAAQIVYGKSAIQGVDTQSSATVDGIDVVFGYPAATESGIIASLDLSSEFTFEEIEGTPNQLAIMPNSISYTETEAEACQMIYTEASDNNTRPTVITQTEGC